MFRLDLVYKYVLRLMKAFTIYLHWIAKRRFPPWSGMQSIKFLLCSTISVISCIFIIYYRRFLTFGIRSLSWARSVEFLPICFSFAMLLGAVIIAVVLLLCICKFRSRNDPYILNCGKYFGIVLKLIMRSTTWTPK